MAEPYLLLTCVYHYLGDMGDIFTTEEQPSKALFLKLLIFPFLILMITDNEPMHLKGHMCALHKD